MRYKTCSSCALSKPEADYTKNASRKDGFHHCCRLCKKEHSKRYRENNKDSVKSSQDNWRKNNPDWYKEYYCKRYPIKREDYLEASSRYRAKKIRAKPNWLGKRHLSQIKELYWLARDLQCVTGELYHVDHIVPLQGENVCGLHVPWNLQVLPADINLSKGNSYADYA